MGVRERLHNTSRRLETFIGVKPMALALLGFFAYANVVPSPLDHHEASDTILPVRIALDSDSPLTPTTSPSVADHPPAHVPLETATTTTTLPPVTVPEPEFVEATLSAQGVDPSPELSMLLYQLSRGWNGLLLVPDTREINGPTEFFVTIDHQCGVQIVTESLPENQIHVASQFFGPLEALTNPEILAKDGTEEAQTAHAEGVPAAGQTFSIHTPYDLAGPLTSIHEGTIFLCHERYPQIQADRNSAG